MKVHVKLASKIYTEEARRIIRKAEHAMAVQAERDSRRYIPLASGKLRASGRVHGNVIVWDQPYARMLWFGNVKVDPKYKKAGFTYPNLGIIRSRPGVKKVTAVPNRGFNFKAGRGKGWFYEAARAEVGHWIQIAQGVIARG